MASRLKKGSAIAAACIAVVSTFEGLRTVAYRDPIGIPTVCFGETRGVKMGDSYTVAQCKDILGDSLKEFETGMRACMKQPDQVPSGAYVAFLSFTYNVGTGAFCKSTLTRKLNSGDVVGACNELPKWDKAAGIRLPGLTKRRTAERALCLNGIRT
ncbi:lysozyme [Rhizobium sp. WYCCWR10014]|uniref:lysozyme n=2 Tax=Rhizobium TaxID=379 RepID=UPI0007E35F6D|nr:lysozyme [Rhizobium sp. WYCCWR10014]OAV53952.1 lysozyme [Rhizobium sp. WYCCWR10014]